MAKPDLKKYGRFVLLGAILIVALSAIVFATNAGSSRRCKGLIIKIKNNSDQFLVTREDIERQVTRFGNDPVDGKVLDNIDLKQIEKRVLENRQIKSCEAYTDLSGQLIVEAEPYIPVARILGGGVTEDRYMDNEGMFFPVSKVHSPRVMLLSGPFFSQIRHLRSEKNEDLRNLIFRIINDPFWSAQITQLDVSRNKEINLVPLLGNHKIEFGKPEKADVKLKKLMVFYKQIWPDHKWEDFTSVSLKYENQIVCN